MNYNCNTGVINIQLYQRLVSTYELSVIRRLHFLTSEIFIFLQLTILVTLE